RAESKSACVLGVQAKPPSRWRRARRAQKASRSPQSRRTQRGVADRTRATSKTPPWNRRRLRATATANRPPVQESVDRSLGGSLRTAFGGVREIGIAQSQPDMHERLDDMIANHAFADAEVRGDLGNTQIGDAVEQKGFALPLGQIGDRSLD